MLAWLVPVGMVFAGLAGCGDGEPVLGTSNVCALFDVTLLDAAVPDGRVLFSQLNSSDEDGSGGMCEIANTTGGPRKDGDVSVLELEIHKEYLGRSAQRREDAKTSLRSVCGRVFEQAPPVVPGEPPAELSCTTTGPAEEQDPPLRECKYAGSRGDTVVWGTYQFLASLTPAEADRKCQAMRDVANSALAPVR
ncbi:hypothetical protein AB0M46_39240 [Dactylosporangium sp. NPDC051485]|uniref:hypothetical protein n=1 Tax=Dactylosporangium sp. NPDC051485 TaxID=3154846 RepID=UPI00344ACE74